jgi:hypothetical protein
MSRRRNDLRCNADVKNPALPRGQRMLTHDGASQTTGPMPVVAGTTRRTSPVCTCRPRNDSITVRILGSDDRLGQRRERSHLCGLTNILKDT